MVPPNKFQPSFTKIRNTCQAAVVCAIHFGIFIVSPFKAYNALNPTASQLLISSSNCISCRSAESFLLQSTLYVLASLLYPQIHLKCYKKISQVLHLISKYTHVNQVKYFSYFDIDQKNNSLILN